VHDGAVFAGSASGALIAVDASTGRERWHVHLSGGHVTVFAPVVDGELVVAAYTDFGTSPRSGGIVAVDAADGRRRWLTRFPRTSAVRAASAAGPPAVTAELVAAAATDGTVYVLSRTTGRVQWSVPPQMPTTLASAMAMVLPSGESEVPLMTEHEDFRVVRVAGSRLIITSLAGVLTAVDLETRATIWRYQSPQDGSNGFDLNVHGEMAYVPFASGRLAIVDAKTGRALQVIGQPTQRFDWPPAVSGDQLYLTSEDGLYVVDLE